MLMKKIRFWLRALFASLLGLSLTLGVVTPSSAADMETVAGTVTDVEGNPVAGVALTVHASLHHGVTRPAWVASLPATGADGAFTTQVPAGATYVVLASTGTTGFIGGYQRFDDLGWFDPYTGGTVLSGAHTLQVKLKVGATISGTVVDPAGKVPAGLTVTIPGQRAASVVEADGSYTIFGVPAGSHYLWAEAEEALISVKRDVVVADKATVTGVDFTIYRGVLVSGRVADRHGKPVAGYGVLVESTGSNPDSVNFATVATDDQGNYSYRVAAGRITVTASAPGYLDSTRAFVGSDGDVRAGFDTTLTEILGTLTAPTPSIAGKAKVGRTLRATAGKWGPQPVTLSYQWFRDGKPIKRATRAAYPLTAKDRGHKITVRVTGVKAGYATATRASKATKKVTR
jgi:hypothetical protein